jgi:hypothetical protein
VVCMGIHVLITESSFNNHWCATCITTAYEDLVVSVILMLTFEVKIRLWLASLRSSSRSG